MTDVSTTCVEVIIRVNVCGWLIVRICVVLRKTVVGCDPGESMFVVG